MAKDKFYAVAIGRNPGIYTTWHECMEQVDGFNNARYRKFETAAEAIAFISVHTGLGRNFHPQVSTTKKGVSKANFVQVNSTTNVTLATPRTFNGGLSTRANIRKLSTTSAPDKRKIDSGNDGIISIKKQKTNDTLNADVDRKEFQVDNEGYVIVYTHGACPINEQHGATAGIGVWFGDHHPLNISGTVDGNIHTIYTAEIQATVQAILQVKERGVTKVNITTDSKPMINCATTWMTKWKSNNWIKATGEPVRNRIDLEKLDAAMNNMIIKWTHVAGHSGDYGNGQADLLAVDGANMRKS